MPVIQLKVLRPNAQKRLRIVTMYVYITEMKNIEMYRRI